MATDALFGIHAAALQTQGRRLQLLAANIANADTPGYKARDLDFASALQQATQEVSSAQPALTDAAHLALDNGDSAQAALVYRVPSQPSVDGNTVDLHAEQAAFADAALHYKASMSFVEGRLRSLMTALTGQ